MDAVKSPTETLPDLVVVSAFGRGNWLASEAATRGWKTTLIDVSEALGTFAPEDIEGPFGLLEASDLTLSQKNRLEDEGELRAVPSGLTVWLKDGPIEFRSDLTGHQLERKEIPVAVDAYLRKQGLPDRDSERERRSLSRKPYQQSWMAHFAHQVASPVVYENFEAIGFGAHWPMFAPFSIRQVTTNGLQKGLKNCQARGVRVLSKAKIRGLTFTGGSLESIDIQGEHSGPEKGRAFVWMLSSLESRNFPTTVSEAFFPKGAIEPDWYWARLSFEITGDLFEDQIPLHAILLEDPCLPWTHTNLLVIRKRLEAKQIDVWAKLPTHFQSQAGRFANFAKSVKVILERRFPSTVMVPQSSVDPAFVSRFVRNPIYTPKTLADLKTVRASNLFFCGPEQWHFLDWLGQYRPQNLLLARLAKMKSQWDASDAKAAARKAARVARLQGREASQNQSQSKQNPYDKERRP